MDGLDLPNLLPSFDLTSQIMTQIRRKKVPFFLKGQIAKLQNTMHYKDVITRYIQGFKMISNIFKLIMS